MLMAKAYLKGAKETDAEYDMTIIDRGVMDGEEKALCEYIVSIPKGEIGLDPKKTPTIQVRKDWFPISELRIMVYHFTRYDIHNQKTVRSKQPAIREAIEKINEAAVLEDTAQVVSFDLLPKNWTK